MTTIPDPPARLVTAREGVSEPAADQTAGGVLSAVAAGRLRPTWAEIDVGAIRDNAAVLAEIVAPARLCAVVKAGGYGHGALTAARAALAGGARWLAVALVEEGLELRQAGITAPVLLLSEPPPAAMGTVVAAGLTPTLYSQVGLRAALSAASERGAAEPVAVHVKVDTGMHRVGASVADAVELATAIAGRPELDLEGVWTHFAVADEPADPFTETQLERFDDSLGRLRAAGCHPSLVHAANSAGALWHPSGRYDLVRCGIALYGLSPSAAGGSWPGVSRLRPALSLKARVSYVKEVAAGEAMSYGLRYRLERTSVVATVPVGYADGVPRRLSVVGGQVLIGGRRCPVAGTVTMDQLLVDCGRDANVAIGDEVVLIGRQADEEITAWEWAERTDTIAYEIVCGVGARVPRVEVGG
jgi:alanine racemase